MKDVPHDVYVSHLRSILASFEAIHETILEWRSGVDGQGHGQQVQQEDQHLLVEHALQGEEEYINVVKSLSKEPWQRFSISPPITLL